MSTAPNIERKYLEPRSIKQRILEPAIKELKVKADAWFEIAERMTEGRRMLGWKLNIKKQPKKNPYKNL